MGYALRRMCSAHCGMGWQVCRGIRGNFAMESVATFAWNRWQLSDGIGGNFRAEYARGYPGSYRRVTAYVSRLRQAQGIPPRRQGRRQRLPVVAEPVAQPLTPRRATWLVLRRAEHRTAAEAQQLASSMRSRPRSPRRWTSRRTLQPSSASGSRSASIPGSRARRPVRWRPSALCERPPRGLRGDQSWPDLALEQRARCILHLVSCIRVSSRGWTHDGDCVAGTVSGGTNRHVPRSL